MEIWDTKRISLIGRLDITHGIEYASRCGSSIYYTYCALVIVFSTNPSDQANPPAAASMGYLKPAKRVL